MKNGSFGMPRRSRLDLDCTSLLTDQNFSLNDLTDAQGHITLEADTEHAA